MFDLKHRCPHCKLLADSTADHDHFRTCINSRYQKAKRLELLTARLNKLYTPPPLRNIVIYHVENYYNNDLLSYPPITNTTLILEACIKTQTSISWGYLIRGRLTSSFYPVFNRIIEPINQVDDYNLLSGIETLSVYYGKCITKHDLNIVILFMFRKH